MGAGSGMNAYNKAYTQNLTYGTNVPLAGCSTATFAFTVKMSDDPTWTPNADKSERLYVQCSGDGGTSWTNLTPNPWPTHQSPCATSYCSGYPTSRSFGWTAQQITLPAACLTATARFRFSATGSSAWRLATSYGWGVDSVQVN
jgi:hypothetical protein